MRALQWSSYLRQSQAKDQGASGDQGGNGGTGLRNRFGGGGDGGGGSGSSGGGGGIGGTDPRFGDKRVMGFDAKNDEAEGSLLKSIIFAFGSIAIVFACVFALVYWLSQERQRDAYDDMY